MSAGRIVYSTGDLDYSIAARLIPAEVFTKPVYDAFVRMYSTDVAVFKVYQSESRRRGKQNAGHYTTVFK